MFKKEGKKLSMATVIIAASLVIIGVYAVVRVNQKKVDTAEGNANDPKVALAQCLTDKGVKMYGAYWCPHCQAQKKDFGDAFRKVTYVECAIPGDSKGQTQACKDADIKGYPTWRFEGGAELSGEQTLEDLSDKAGCAYEGKR